MIREWIDEYKPRNQQEAEAALREIMQEVALAGLQRSGFFEMAAFYGGIALRIFYGLDRFSEDLDFSLLTVNPEFSLEPHFQGIIAEFEAIGMEVTIKEKNIVLEGVIPQAGIQHPPTIKIKLEVDREPPLGFDTEEKLLLKPFSFYVKCFTLPDLFAGKMHALLFRKWKQRVKGRDWYDLEWYIKKGVPLHLQHFLLRAQDSGNWTPKTISKDRVIQLLNEKIDTVSFDRIREDVVRFIRDDKALEIWSPRYFKDLVGKIRFK
jgi:hypothetical protein